MVVAHMIQGSTVMTVVKNMRFLLVAREFGCLILRLYLVIVLEFNVQEKDAKISSMPVQVRIIRGWHEWYPTGQTQTTLMQPCHIKRVEK
jgi:hypothetical protein